MRTDAQQRTIVRPAGYKGHIGSSPVRVVENEKGAIEVGAYQVSRNGYGFTVALVAKFSFPGRSAEARKLTEATKLAQETGSAEALNLVEDLKLAQALRLAEAMELATIDQPAADKKSKAVVTVKHLDGRVGSTLDAHLPQEQRDSSLNVDTSFGHRGAGSHKEQGSGSYRQNGEVVVQHGVIVVDLPPEVELARRQERNLVSLWASGRAQDHHLALHNAAALKGAAAVGQVEISVDWEAIDLHVKVNAEVVYTPDPQVLLSPGMRVNEVALA